MIDSRNKPTRAAMSFGGGVQSTALAFLALERDPRLLEQTGGVVPELYLFADTGDERRATYAHVWKMAEVFAAAGVPLQIVMRGETSTNRGKSLSNHILTRNGGRGKGIATAPFFVETLKGDLAPTRRTCTSQFKIGPLMKAQRDWFQPPRGTEKPIWQQWLGISMDEAHRMKDADRRYYMTFHPLVWMRWSRQHCVEYLKGKRYADGSPVQIVRSSCVYCPFHDAEEWRAVQSDPEDWKAACHFDRTIRKVWKEDGLGGIKAPPFLHRSGKPIEEIDFSEDSDQMSLWGEECAGVCGV